MLRAKPGVAGSTLSSSPTSAAGVAGLEGRSAMASHPLEPLSADEFRRTAEILRRDGQVTDSFRFASIELVEPAKQEVLAWRLGEPVPRHSFAVVWNRLDNKTYEATVDLTGDAVLSISTFPAPRRTSPSTSSTRSTTGFAGIRR